MFIQTVRQKMLRCFETDKIFQILCNIIVQNNFILKINFIHADQFCFIYGLLLPTLQYLNFMFTWQIGNNCLWVDPSCLLNQNIDHKHRTLTFLDMRRNKHISKSRPRIHIKTKMEYFLEVSKSNSTIIHSSIFSISLDFLNKTKVKVSEWELKSF